MVIPKVPKKGSYNLDMEAGTYVWCGCGLSNNQPFCDGAHKGTEYAHTEHAAKVVEIEEDRNVHWCGCKNTKNPPFCDGSHKNL